ncbi:glycogen/starch synthase, partial [Saccharophagus degradans]
MYQVHIENLLDREEVYGYEDDTERVIAFQKVVLDWILQFAQVPKIIHCHDHHTGLIPFMLTQCTKYIPIRGIPTVFTIHNAQY